MDDGLRVRLTSDERAQLVRHPTTDGDAYDLYLQARYSQRLATEEDYLFSRTLLESAVVRDPKFALAYASLAGNYAMMLVDGLERPTDAWPQVRRYMRQALEIDPTLPEAIGIEHAFAFLFDWDWAGAEAVRRRLLASSIGAFRSAVRESARRGAVGAWADEGGAAARAAHARTGYAQSVSRGARSGLSAPRRSVRRRHRAVPVRHQARSAERERATSASPRRGCGRDDSTRRSRPGAERTRWPATTG